MFHSCTRICIFVESKRKRPDIDDSDAQRKKTVGTRCTKTGNVKRPWSGEERDAVFKHLGKFILLKKLPGKSDISKCIEAEPALCHRNWRNIKDHCRNSMAPRK